MIEHQSDLQIDATNELFPTQSNLFEDTVSSPNNIRTAVHGQGDTIQLSIRRLYKGIPVTKSRATATIKRGNLVNIGLEQWGDIPKGFNVEPRLTEQDAKNAIAIKTGLVLTDEITCKPELEIMTSSRGDVRVNSLRFNSFGEGYTHRLVWKVCPKFEGQNIEKMEGIVDAVTGEVLSFVDTVDYLQAVGDVYPFSNDGKDQGGSLQDAWPMPFMKVGTSTTFTSTGGNFDLVGTQTGKLSGKYVEVSRMCAFNTSKHIISSASHILMTSPFHLKQPRCVIFVVQDSLCQRLRQYLTVWQRSPPQMVLTLEVLEAPIVPRRDLVMRLILIRLVLDITR